MLQISQGLRIPVGSNCSYNGQKMESFLKLISSIIENPCLYLCRRECSFGPDFESPIFRIV